MKGEPFMKNASVLASCCVAVGVAAAAQEVPVTLQVDVENQVRYGGYAEPAQIATSPVPVASPVQQLNFNRPIVIGDVTAVNGSPTKGVLVSLENNVRITPTPTAPLPGGAISDAMFPSVAIHSFDFLKPSGERFGSIFVVGFPAPGQPGPGGAIMGGTGAFVGARGTINGTAGLAIRTTSQAEDPSMRRVNGGGRGTYVIQLLPMFRPEVLIGVNGAAVFHSDYSPVTSSNPARAGGTLIVYCKGLGPTTPSVNPGEPFPNQPFAVAISPVEVLVNGKSSPAVNQIGVPGTTDTYRVDFRLPNDTTAGTAQVQISAAWVKGAAVTIAVR
jgi:uncharacterized protein (TIGR03437 family)